MMMVKAGSVVDAFIDTLVSLLEPGDIIIDGGNSLYTDTNRRTQDLAKKGNSVCRHRHFRRGGRRP